MSGGKKKSGFQITSVTSDYQPKEGGSARPPHEADAGEGEGPQPKEEAAARNGPSAPGSPGAQPPSFQGPGGVAGSRFRVVKLDQGSGEPYKRGRWTCRDFYEQEADQPLGGRLADSARHPQSLDSRLEVAGLLPKPLSLYSPQPQRRGVYLHSQLVLPSPASSGHQARSLGGGLPLLAHANRTLPSPGSLHSPLAVPEPRSPAPGDSAKESGNRSPPGTIPALTVEEHLLPKSVTQLIQRETEERSKVLPRESRSRPSSPAPPLLRDASPSQRTSDPFSAARFSLARSIFGMGVAPDSDSDSGTNSSMIAIDNKIEQAMDLVKSHLMFAVREEVEVLREQIKELSERNALLEQENALLRSLASSEQLSHFQAQLHAVAKPPPSSTA
uniref:sperm acrosome developmental regulator n=1 Tax=Euleptes europaea TaxID=460621 RepID=UPI0025418DC9|nr:sperm acrosome developmental regulator [Euleptes europaea]